MGAAWSSLRRGFQRAGRRGASCLVGPLEGVLFVIRAASTDVIRERVASAPWLRDVTLSFSMV
jgi:hypothetical protein